jgi:membrane protein insertase Oxa1/YidC/SpoIIIJ
MIKELNKDVFVTLKDMAEDIHLVSRNYNDELIGIDYYANLAVLKAAELTELIDLWHVKTQTCHKEKLASQWMVIQIFIIISFAEYMASISGGVIVVTIAGLLGIIAMIAMLEDKRTSNAKRNLKDAITVHQHLQDHLSDRQALAEEESNKAILAKL